MAKSVTGQEAMGKPEDVLNPAEKNEQVLPAAKKKKGKKKS